MVQAPDLFRQQLLAAVPRLRRYARSLTFDAGTADHLVQTALERALSHWHQFDQRRDMLVWLLSIAHNAFLDQRRRDSRMRFVDPAQADAQQDLQRADPGADVGLRIDLILASSALAQKCGACHIDKAPRQLERPSDHTPVVASFDI